MDQDREERVRARAYEIWEREGRQDGGHEAHWQQAEKELREEESGERQQEEGQKEEEGAATPNATTSNRKRGV
jgi:hypothetical protein